MHIPNCQCPWRHDFQGVVILLSQAATGVDLSFHSSLSRFDSMTIRPPCHDFPGTAGRVQSMRQLLSCAFLSACILLSPNAWATTLAGERFTRIDDAWGFLGYDIDVDGDVAAVGAWIDDGAVQLYERDPQDEQWRNLTTLSEPEDTVGLNFGFNVWLDNDLLIVGAPGIFSDAPGKAFIYERDGSTGDWELQAELSAGEGPALSGFGREVNIQGNRAAVSVSPGAYIDGNDTIVIFERDLLGSGWTQTTEIAISDSEFNSVGISDMTMSDEQLIVAVTDTAAASRILVFERMQDENAWVETDELTPGSAVFNQGTDLGLSMDEDRLLVTDPRDASYHLFERDQATGNWVYDPDFTSQITTVPTDYARAAAVDGDLVIVADPSNAGADVYLHNEPAGEWVQIANLSLGSYAGNTITSVSLSGNNVWLGTPYQSDTDEGLIYANGSAFAYRLSDELLDLDLSDLDNDGVSEADDNCPVDYNPTQSDYDDDLLGDACDQDDDNDGVDDALDAFPYDASRQEPDAVPAVPELYSPYGSDVHLESAFFWPVVSGARFYVIEVQHEGSIRAYESMIPAAVACKNGQCAYYKTDAVKMGNNRWRLRAGNDFGVSAWSPWTDFVVSLPAESNTNGPVDGSDAFDRFPGMPLPSSPSGTGYARNVSFQWDAVPGIIDYAIEIQHEGLTRAWEPDIPANLACSSDVCEFVKSDAALPGNNRWRLSARNNAGQTQWSDWVVFTVSESTPPVVTPPAVPVPGNPQGDAVEPGSDYTWAAVDGAMQYAIEIQHDGEIRGYDNTIYASDACDADICRYTKPDAARSGSNRWRVGAYGDYGFSGWSQWQTFIVD